MSLKHRLKTMDELGRLDIEQFKNSAKLPICLILDNVRSLHNVGSAFRTADAFRLDCLYLCGITATPPHREINKAALGATESVEWKYCENTLDLVEKLTAAGYMVYAVEQTQNSISLERFMCNILREPNTDACAAEAAAANIPPIALIFGNEVNGVQQSVVEACQGSIEIPQYGTKHSLNVSVSIGIVLWEMVRGN